MAETYRDQLLAELSRKETLMKKGFSELLDITISKIPQVIFVRDFLPMFSGEIEPSEYLMSHWYTISGGPFNSVRVVDNIGEIVATVPPVLDRDLVGTESNTNISVSEIFQDYKSLSYISPTAAANKMHSELVNNYMGGVKKQVNSELAEKWAMLLNHYGKDNKAKASANKKQAVDDDVEYD